MVDSRLSTNCVVNSLDSIHGNAFNVRRKPALRHTVKLLITARAALNFRRALDPAAIGGRGLLEVYN